MSKVSNNKIFRAEKTTSNRDDFKVMIVGSVIGILLLLVFPVIERMYDQSWVDHPLVKVTVEATQTEGYQCTMAMYNMNTTMKTCSVVLHPELDEVKIVEESSL